MGRRGAGSILATSRRAGGGRYRVRIAYSLSSEAPIPLPGNSLAMIPATVAAIPGLPLPAVDPCTLPATPPSHAPAIRFTP